MICARRVVVLVAVSASLQLACGPLRSRTPQRKGQATVVLLPESDGTVGRAVVSNPAGAVELGTARASTLVVPGQPPEPVTEMPDRGRRTTVRRRAHSTAACSGPLHVVLPVRLGGADRREPQAGERRSAGRQGVSSAAGDGHQVTPTRSDRRNRTSSSV